MLIFFFMRTIQESRMAVLMSFGLRQNGENVCKLFQVKYRMHYLLSIIKTKKYEVFVLIVLPMMLCLFCLLT